MAMFNSYVSLPEGITIFGRILLVYLLGGDVLLEFCYDTWICEVT